jgi:hypothetical protein
VVVNALHIHLSTGFVNDAVCGLPSERERAQDESQQDSGLTLLYIH